MSDPRFDQRPPYRDELGQPVPESEIVQARSSNAMWGWIAGAVFVVIVLALVFGPSGTSDNQTALDSRPAANSVTTAPHAASTPIERPAPSTTGQGSGVAR